MQAPWKLCLESFPNGASQEFQISKSGQQ